MISPLMKPFELIWKLIAGILTITGRLVAGIIGSVLIALGALLCLTVIGAIAGIPMIIIGVLLLIRSLF